MGATTGSNSDSSRKAFHAKAISPEERRRKNAAIKRIHRDYERMHSELERGGPPMMKKGVKYYVFIIAALFIAGALVLTKTGERRAPQPTKAQINVRKSIDALAVALGRYRYHVGSYPTTEEGLAILAARQVAKKGWVGPYINHVVKDPWKRDYVYVSNGESAIPTLYSKGADGVAGTTDDVMPDPALFEEPFRDTSWTKGWMPWHLRGYMVVQDEEEKKIAEGRVQKVLQDEAEAASAAALRVESAARFKTVAEFLEAGAACPLCGELGCAKKIHITPHWNWEGKEGEPIAVKCVAEGDEAELYLNNETQGRKALANSEALWNVPYEPGELKAIVFRAGNYIGETVMTTAWQPRNVRLMAGAKSLTDGETCLVRAVLLDEKGVRCPVTDAEVVWNIQGPGEIIDKSPATGNGVFDVVVRRVVPNAGEAVKVTASAAKCGSAVLDLGWSK